jgi:hypothetical protein
MFKFRMFCKSAGYKNVVEFLAIHVEKVGCREREVSTLLCHFLGEASVKASLKTLSSDVTYCISPVFRYPLPHRDLARSTWT